MEIPKHAKQFIFLLSLIGIVVLVVSGFMFDINRTIIYVILVFLLLNTAAESLPVLLPNQTSVTVSYATIFASVLLFQPIEVICITVLGYLLSLDKKKNYFKVIFNIAQLTISSGTTSLVYQYLGRVNLTQFSLNLNNITTLVLTSMTYLVLNTLLVTIVVSIVQNEEPYPFFLANIKWGMPNFLCMAPLGFLIAIIYTHVGIWGLVLFFIPLLLARHSFKSYMDMRQSFLDTIQSLTAAIDAKDSYTKGHSARVADYTVAIAKELGYPEDGIEKIKYIALLHDAGKIGIKEDILNKPARLTDVEFCEMQRHSSIGAEIVKNVKVLEGGADIIRHHHEHFNSKGYPDGVSGNDIPEGSRIISVADAFDAMTSDRPYRKALTSDVALTELKNCSDTQFDPRVVEAFVKVYPSIKLTSKNDSSTSEVIREVAATRERSESKET